MSQQTVDQAWLESVIADFLRDSPHNRLWPDQPEKAWDDFLLGLAAGDDELWELYKREYVGPFHYRPEELFNLHFPESPAAPADLTVISYILPQREATRRDNRAATAWPAERWARARIFGEEANKKLREHLVAALAAAGVDAVARCSRRTGRWRSRTSISWPRAGRSATRPTPPGWAPSGSATGSSPPRARPCGWAR